MCIFFVGSCFFESQVECSGRHAQSHGGRSWYNMDFYNCINVPPLYLQGYPLTRLQKSTRIKPLTLLLLMLHSAWLDGRAVCVLALLSDSPQWAMRTWRCWHSRNMLNLPWKCAVENPQRNIKVLLLHQSQGGREWGSAREPMRKGLGEADEC